LLSQQLYESEHDEAVAGLRRGASTPAENALSVSVQLRRAMNSFSRAKDPSAPRCIVELFPRTTTSWAAHSSSA
jgi:hypothetical protein